MKYICCYADDTTFSGSHESSGALTRKLSENYKVIAEFMVTNRLKLNDEKTHLLVISTSQAKAERNRAEVKILTPTSVIRPSRSERLLGCWIQDDLKWTEHLRDNKEENLIRSLNTRLGALRKIRKVASFKNRKIIANGIMISKLSYLISLWGCGGVGLRRSLQVIMNRAARVVLK